MAHLIFRRWRQILARTYHEFGDDQLSIIASGVAFRVAIATFPGIGLLVWLGTRLISAQGLNALLPIILGVVPDSSRTVITQAVQSSLQNNPADSAGQLAGFGVVAPIVGLVFTIWSTNSGMKALFRGLNIVYDTEERRSFLKFTGITLLFTAATIISMLLASVLILSFPTVMKAVGISGSSLAWLNLLRWPTLFVGVIIALMLLYRFAPHRDGEKWPLVTFGSTLASLLLVLSSVLFSWFVDRFASLAVTYGSLSTMVAFMLWLWVTFWIVLACAELDSSIERETGSYSRKAREHGQ